MRGRLILAKSQAGRRAGGRERMRTTVPRAKDCGGRAIVLPNGRLRCDDRATMQMSCPKIHFIFHTSPNISRSFCHSRYIRFHTDSSTEHQANQAPQFLPALFRTLTRVIPVKPHGLTSVGWWLVWRPQSCFVPVSRITRVSTKMTTELEDCLQVETCIDHAHH